jgi:hypothetical protein
MMELSGLLPASHSSINSKRSSKLGALRSSISVLLSAHLFPLALPRQSLLGATLVAGLHVVGMFLDLFDDIFLLYSSFETTQSTLDRFTVLDLDLGHSFAPPFLQKMGAAAPPAKRSFPPTEWMGSKREGPSLRLPSCHAPLDIRRIL